jgi:hypothetical protein
MYHRRLNKRLENCKDWTEFESVDSNYNHIKWQSKHGYL